MKKEEERKSERLFIIHFQPLERFPPVQNLLRYLANHIKGKITVITTANKSGSGLSPYKSHSDNLKIRRTPGIIPGSFFRIVNYAGFYLYSLLLLIKTRPQSVLYFETLSSWPALVYKKLRGKKVRLLLHCHEYTSPADYKNMWLVQQIHEMEKKMYADAYAWISHTNEVRLEQFKKDHFLENVDTRLFHTMPNYPPKSWSAFQTDFHSKEKIRLVFVGSLGYDNMYLQETVEWVMQNEAHLSLDIYAYNIDQKARDLLQSITTECINYYQGCDYSELPAILQNYDVGLVLYKPYNYNHINGISNKVYEYLACGLDVWFPKDNSHMLSIEREIQYPKVLAVDFKNLSHFDYCKAVRREGISCCEDGYFYEKVYEEIGSAMSASEENGPDQET